VLAQWCSQPQPEKAKDGKGKEGKDDTPPSVTESSTEDEGAREQKKLQEALRDATMKFIGVRRVEAGLCRAAPVLLGLHFWCAWCGWQACFDTPRICAVEGVSGRSKRSSFVQLRSRTLLLRLGVDGSLLEQGFWGV